MEEICEAPYDIENLCTPLLTSMRQTRASPCCIYRVPEPLRCVNERAYTPQVVSIGPLHHGKEGLKDMEEHKKMYLPYFLRRTRVRLEDHVKKIRDKEAELRSCYAHAIELCSEDFVRIILVDAAFIIEFLLRFDSPNVPESNDRIFNKPWLKNYIALDMLLLENQLPFFILEDLIATAEVPATMSSVFHLSYNCFRKSTTFYGDRDDLESYYRFKVEHFVDLIRTIHLPAKKERSKTRGSVQTQAIPTMRKLHKAGVKLKARSTNNPFDICFKDGILEIPNLRIDDHMEPLLRNLIAFELCHCHHKYFTDYIILMDKLVNTPDDVDLLVKNEIVENLLGNNNEVSTLINGLCKGFEAPREEFYYATLTMELSDYYKKSWNKWVADLQQTYFNSPWATISLVAGTLVIILTIIQTVCSFSQCSLS